MITQEVAKNLDPRTAVKCSGCNKQHTLVDLVHESPLDPPHNTVVEGYLLCPTCGHKTHSYYMPETLRYEQERLKKALIVYHSEKTYMSFKKYEKIQKAYQKNFAAAQVKYRELMEKTPSE